MIDAPGAQGAAVTSSIVYSGEPGAFAEDAVLAAFGDVPRRGVGGFRAVFEAVTRDGGVGVVPVENLLGGTVRETLDLLLEHDLRVVAEIVVPVRLCVAALPGQRLEDLDRIYSHIQALGQAERFLRTRSWQLLTTYNTAGAAKLIVDGAERGAGAVLSPRAAGLFGLEVLADDVADDGDNRTRFLAIAPQDGPVPGLASTPGDREGATRRTLLAFGVRNEPGTLLAALHVFADRGLNLSRLESRPSRAARWEYVFWVDLDADADDPTAAAALDELRRQAAMVRVLGSYTASRD